MPPGGIEPGTILIQVSRKLAIGRRNIRKTNQGSGKKSKRFNSRVEEDWKERKHRSDEFRYTTTAI